MSCSDSPAAKNPKRLSWRRVWSKLSRPPLAGQRLTNRSRISPAASSKPTASRPPSLPLRVSSFPVASPALPPPPLLLPLVAPALAVFALFLLPSAPLFARPSVAPLRVSVLLAVQAGSALTHAG